MKKNVIYFVSIDQAYTMAQIDEIQHILKRYDIGIITNTINHIENDIKRLLTSDLGQDTVFIAAILIKQKLTIVNTGKNDSFQPALDECMLDVYKLDNDNFSCKHYQGTVEGYLAITGGNDQSNNDVIDKQLLLKNTLLTYHELSEYKMKNTSLGQALSQFVCDELYYSPAINLNFHPQQQQRSIDFSNDPVNLLTHNPYFNNPFAEHYGITNAFKTVMNNGLFFRSAKNRREKNYWCPTLNAGLPLIPKRDIIHETTFMAHDFFHFLIPDLIYTGQHSEMTQQVYVAYRMMSEAFTLVLADMVFVDSLKKSGVEYDYSKRRIYPLFEEFEFDLTDKQLFFNHLEDMLRASVYYCLKGDDSKFIKLSKHHHKSSVNLDNFTEKYMKFFCEDFKWTRHNYDYFKLHSSEMKRWWELVNPLRQRAELAIETISEFGSKLALQEDDIIEPIFNLMYARVKNIIANKEVQLDTIEKRRFKAFYRYMMGQLLLFVRYESVVKESRIFQRILLNYLTNLDEQITLENITFCRNIVSEFIDLLLSRHLIHHDDALTYKEVFPLFEPCFVFYDERKEFYRELAIVAHESIYH